MLMKIPLKATMVYDYPIVYVNQTTSKLDGLLAKLLLNNNPFLTSFNLTWIGRETSFGACNQNQCSGAVGLVQRGEADLFARDMALSDFDQMTENISVSTVVRDEHCDFLTHFRPRNVSTFSIDCLESLEIFKADYWIFLCSFYCSIYLIIRLLSSRSQQSPNQWTWLIMFLQGRIPRKLNYLQEIIALTVSLTVVQSYMIYIAQFDTDSSVEIPDKPITSFNDLVKRKISFGVDKHSHCFKIVESLNNAKLSRLARPYISSKEFYVRSRKLRQYTLFATNDAKQIHASLVCALRDGSRYYIRKYAFPSVALVYSYNSRFDNNLGQIVSKRFYHFAESGLEKNYFKEFLIDVSRIYFNITSQRPCSHKRDLNHNFNFEVNILQIYSNLLLSLYSVCALALIVLFLEIIVALDLTFILVRC